MKLYLVRHAEAEDGDVDAQRRLTEQGRADARRLADALRPMSLRVAEIWHSGYPRAAQTAEPIAHVVTAAVVKPHEGLTPFDRTRPIAKLVKCHGGGDLMIVGHEPFLGKLAARLVTGRASRGIVKLDKPCVVCIDDAERGEWRICWMISRDVAATGEPRGLEPQRGPEPHRMDSAAPNGTDGPPL